MVKESPKAKDVSTPPDLESVKYKTEVSRVENIIASAFIVILTLFFSGLFLWMGYGSRDLFRNDTLFTIFEATITLIAILINYVLIRSLMTRQYYWETDSEGLTIGDLFRDRFLTWDSVEDAEILPRRKPLLVFTTSQGKLSITYDALQGSYLYPSIRQHLEKRGKAEKLPLLRGHIW